MGHTKEYPADIFSRIASLERQQRMILLNGSGPFSEIQIGEATLTGEQGNFILTNSGGEVIVASTNPLPAPTWAGTPLVTDTVVNETYVLVDWVAPVGAGSEAVIGYEVEVTRVGVGVVRTDPVNSSLTAVYISPLEPGQNYSFRVRALSNSAASAWTSSQAITAALDDTLPNAVTGLTVAAGFQTVILKWNASTDYDVQRGKGQYEAQVDIVSTFNSGSLRTWKGSAIITAFEDLGEGITSWYARVRAVDASGNVSAWSATVGPTSTLQVKNVDVFADLSAAKITVGTMSGDRITANTADIAILKTSSLTSQIITIAGTGVFRIGRTITPFHYMLQDVNGIRFYSSGSAAFTGGALSFEINMNTGAIELYGGTIKTAATGQRVEITGVNTDRITFFTGHATESLAGYMFSNISGTLDQLGLWIRGPQSTVNPKIGEFAVFASRSGYDAGCEMRSWNSSGFTTLDCLFKVNPVVIYGYVWANPGGRQIFIDNTVAALCFAGSGQRIRIEQDRTKFVSQSNALIFQCHDDTVEFWKTGAMNDWGLQFRGFNDPNHRIQFNSGIDGLEIVGFQRIWMIGTNQNISVYLNNNALEALSADGNSWKDVKASGYQTMSDIRLKEDVEDYDDDECLKELEETAQQLYTQNGRRSLGFVAQQVPPHAKLVSPKEVRPAGGVSRPETASYDLVDMVASNWGATRALIKRVKELEAKLL